MAIAQKIAATKVALKKSKTLNDSRNDSDTEINVRIVSATDFLKNNISFQFNCRAPSRASKAYKDMRKQIEEKPDAFVHLNSGVVLANKIYLLDGGHTHLALKDAKDAGDDLSKVFLKITEYSNLSKDQMIERSKGLNNKVTPPLRGERDLNGDWDELKENLSPDVKDLFEFKPNTAPSAPYKVDFLVGILHALNGKSVEKAYTNKGLLVRLFNQDKYERVVERLNDGIQLYSRIALDLSKSKKVRRWAGVRQKDIILPDGTEAKYIVPDAYIMPLFAAFSTLIGEDGEWKQDPFKVWKKAMERMILQLTVHYRSLGKSPQKVGRSQQVYSDSKVALLSPLAAISSYDDEDEEEEDDED